MLENGASQDCLPAAANSSLKGGGDKKKKKGRKAKGAAAEEEEREGRGEGEGDDGDVAYPGLPPRSPKGPEAK